VDLATIGGIGLGSGIVLVSIMMGGDIMGFVNVPSLLVVFGGTFSGVLVMYPLGTVIGAIKTAIKTVKYPIEDPKKLIPVIVELAKKVRKDGALSLQTYKTPNLFLAKGIGMMVDGMDANSIRSVLSTEIDAMRERHNAGSVFFDDIGLLAPAFGMIGTLIGLVQMLQSLSDPSAIGPSMAVALLTTFYGAFSANLFAVPMAKKLSIRSGEESLNYDIIMEGIVSIVKKENPAIMQNKLNAFLSPKNRMKS